MDPEGAGSTMELPPPELHANILRAIKLSPRQRRAAVAYRNHLLSRMGTTLRQRRDISLQLLRTLGAQQLPTDQQARPLAGSLYPAAPRLEYLFARHGSRNACQELPALS